MVPFLCRWGFSSIERTDRAVLKNLNRRKSLCSIGWMDGHTAQCFLIIEESIWSLLLWNSWSLLFLPDFLRYASSNDVDSDGKSALWTHTPMDERSAWEERFHSEGCWPNLGKRKYVWETFPVFFCLKRCSARVPLLFNFVMHNLLY